MSPECLQSLALFVLVCSGSIVAALEAATRSAGANFDESDRLRQAAPVLAIQTPASDFEKFKQSGLFLEPFEPELISLPASQVEFARASSTRDIALFRKILNEAIETRKNFAPGPRLIIKYGARLIASFIRNRNEELALPDRHPTKGEFFIMVAKLMDDIMDMSEKIKRDKGYTKQNVDVEDLRQRAEAIFNYYQRIIDISPLGGYLRWDKCLLFSDQPENKRHKVELAPEAADLYAMFRAIGYDGSAVIGRQIVKMIRLFAEGKLPSLRALQRS